MAWKRKDITARMVLESYADKARRDAGLGVDEDLVMRTGAPEKVVWSAMWRELYAGRVDYGVNLRRGWLTDKGVAFLKGIGG